MDEEFDIKNSGLDNDDIHCGTCGRLHGYAGAKICSDCGDCSTCCYRRPDLHVTAEELRDKRVMEVLSGRSPQPTDGESLMRF